MLNWIDSFIICNIMDLGQAIDEAKRLMTKEKLVRQMYGQSVSTLLMSFQDCSSENHINHTFIKGKREDRIGMNVILEANKMLNRAYFR